MYDRGKKGMMSEYEKISFFDKEYLTIYGHI